MILLKNGCVHDGKLNVLADTDVLIENGKIKAVGKGLEAPGAEVIDASGKHIYPGFIAATTEWGVKGPGWRENDNAEKCDPVTPEMNMVYGFDHDCMNFQHVYEYGVTAAGVTPSSGNVLGGQGAVFKTEGRTPYKMLVKESAFMAASASDAVKSAYQGRMIMPMTMMGVFSLLEGALKKGADYKEGPDAKAAAMKKVVDGEIPLFVNVMKRAHMDVLTELLKAYPNVRLVLTGAYGLDSTYAPVAEGKVPVLMGDYAEIFEKEKRTMNYDEVIGLMNKGLDVAISLGGDGPAGGKECILWNAILYIKHGLCPERAVAAVTSVPAKILGIGDRVGAIEAGMDADISVWSNDPFRTYQAKCEMTFINGEDVLNRKERYSSCW